MREDDGRRIIPLIVSPSLSTRSAVQVVVAGPDRTRRMMAVSAASPAVAAMGTIRAAAGAGTVPSAAASAIAMARGAAMLLRP